MDLDVLQRVCELLGIREDVGAGQDYFYVVNGNERPDPVSRSQPSGVHGPSRVVAHDAFE